MYEKKLAALFAAILAGSVCSLKAATLEGSEAAKIIRNEATRDHSFSPLCEANSCCTVSESQSCGIETFPIDKTTLVLPGGISRCIYSTSTPYSFQVIPGAKDKLVVYFQGGGACWDEMSTKMGLCTSSTSPSSLSSGIFDRADERNKYKDYTIVQLLYCSGDIWGGNVTRDYSDSNGVPVQQMGLANAEATLNWIVEQQKTGSIASTLTDLVVMGCSAGSIGAQLWGNQIIKTLKWEKTAVLPDSYAGVFPPNSQGPLIQGFGFCGAATSYLSLSDELIDKCNAGELTLQDINMEFIGATPEVPYAFIQSKTDIVQESFYVAIGLTSGTDAFITPTTFYQGVNDIFLMYNQYPNFLGYLVDGDQHCFTPSDVYFSADGTGPRGNGENATQPMLYSWTADFPLASGEGTFTVCEGEETNALTLSVSSAVTEVPQTKNYYCSDELIPKEYTQA